MAQYRIYLIGLDGYLIESTFINCLDDQDALSKATEMLRTFYAAVEVWDGSRKVGHLEAGRTFPDGKH
jgi:hypothetical protein